MTTQDHSDRTRAYHLVGQRIGERHRMFSLTEQEYQDLCTQARTGQVLDRQGPPPHTQRAVHHRGKKIVVLRNEETGLVVDCLA